jgi:hypothetical protein
MKDRCFRLLPALALLAACTNPVTDNGDHARDVAGVEVYAAAQPELRLARTVGQRAAMQWEGAIPEIPAGQTHSFAVRWVNSAGQPLVLGTRYATRIRFAADPHNTGNLVRENATVRLASEEGRVSITGRAAGEASVVLVLWHGSHDDWASPALGIRVVAP